MITIIITPFIQVWIATPTSNSYTVLTTRWHCNGACYSCSSCWIQTYTISAKFIPSSNVLIAASSSIIITSCIVIFIITMIVFCKIWGATATNSWCCSACCSCHSCWIQTFTISAEFIPSINVLIATSSSIIIASCIVILIITMFISCKVWGSTFIASLTILPKIKSNFWIL